MAELVCEKCHAVSKNSKAFCRECGGKLIVQAPKRGGKLRKAGVKTLRRTFFIALALFIIATVISVVTMGYFAFNTSGLEELKPSSDDEVRALQTVSYIHNDARMDLLMTQGEATFLCNQLLKKSIKGDPIIIKAKRRLEVRVDKERQSVSTILYDKIQREIDIRCELGWVADDGVPKLSYVRLGRLYLPKLLHVPVVQFFESRAVIGAENAILVKRIDKIAIAANNTLRVTLADPRKMD